MATFVQFEVVYEKPLVTVGSLRSEGHTKFGVLYVLHIKYVQ